MTVQKAIYTEQGQCQDCYKCVRHCPVKAIRVERGSARVMAERCVYCGTCVTVCPSGAKRVRDDLGRARVLLKRRRSVHLSLAPSWVSEFPGVAPRQMVAALRRLGFRGVSETALGAQEVNAACADLLARSGPALHLSTACPAVVDYVRRYRPALVPRLTPVLSPMLAHARLLRRLHGPEVGILFAGPCIAKKEEADGAPDLVDGALTFHELRRWLEALDIDPAQAEPGPEDVFTPFPARDGALYPMEGGMNAGIRQLPGGAGVHYMSFSGLGNVASALEGLETLTPGEPLFVELLACEGGCLKGPRMSRTCGTALRRLEVDTYTGPLRQPAPEGTPDLDVSAVFTGDPVDEPHFTEAELEAALKRVGKATAEDELNCGGCGYETCRALATALLAQRAEPDMCVSHMRRLALNKAGALMRSMPSGVVIVDEAMDIVECNERFAGLLGEEARLIQEARPGMAGAALAKVAPALAPICQQVMEGDLSVVRRDLRLGERVLRGTWFPLEAGSLVGCILQDITEPAVQREQTIARAQEVIRKNITTVQQIAFLLGENAAETEMILNSIVDSFQVHPIRPERG